MLPDNKPLKLKTLIVEDSPKIVETINTILNQYCPNVDVVGNAGNKEEAYLLINSLKPDLLLLDIQLPEGTSFDVLQRLKANGNPFHFEMIFITGHLNEENQTKAINLSVLSSIKKPINHVELVEAVDLAYKRHGQIQERAVAILLDLVGPALHPQMIVPLLKGQTGKINLKDIVSLRADDSMCRIGLANGTELRSSKSLRFFEQNISSDHILFFQIKGGILLNLDYLKGQDFKKNLVFLTTGQSIEASRRGSQELKKYLETNQPITEESLIAKITKFFGK